MHRPREYKPPKWCNGLKNIPATRVQISMPNTPVQQWNLSMAEERGIKLFLKREDLTGCTLSGNKVRKIDFIMAEAMGQGCSAILTFGGHRSNFCRVAAVAAKQCGLEAHLILQARTEKATPGYECNHLIWELCGTQLYSTNNVWDCKELVNSIKNEIFKRTKKNCYVSPLGACSVTGAFGDFEVWNELLESGTIDEIDDIVVPCAVGASAGGLAIANYLCGSRVRVHGVAIGPDKEEQYYGRVQEIIIDLGLELNARDIVDIMIGYEGKGFLLATDENLAFNRKVCNESGIFLDATFTGKALEGFFKEFDKNPKRFKGNRILFVHTGGLFNVFETDTTIPYKPGLAP